MSNQLFANVNVTNTLTAGSGIVTDALTANYAQINEANVQLLRVEDFSSTNQNLTFNAQTALNFLAPNVTFSANTANFNTIVGSNGSFTTLRADGVTPVGAGTSFTVTAPTINLSGNAIVNSLSVTGNTVLGNLTTSSITTNSLDIPNLTTTTGNFTTVNTASLNATGASVLAGVTATSLTSPAITGSTSVTTPLGIITTVRSNTIQPSSGNISLSAPTVACTGILTATTSITSAAITGSTSVTSPTVTGSTVVITPLLRSNLIQPASGNISLTAPLVTCTSALVATTSITSPSITGSTSVSTPLASVGVLTASSKVVTNLIEPVAGDLRLLATKTIVDILQGTTLVATNGNIENIDCGLAAVDTLVADIDVISPAATITTVNCTTLNGVNSRLTGSLTVGPNVVAFPQPGVCLRAINTSVLDSSCEGLQPGSGGAFHQASFGHRNLTVSQDQINDNTFYLGMSGGAINPTFEYTFTLGKGLQIRPFLGQAGPAPTYSEALAVVGDSRITGTLTAATINATNSRMTGTLIVGPNNPFNSQPGVALQVCNISVTDTTANGLQAGSTGMQHQASFGGRNWTFSSDAVTDTILYFSSTGSGGDDPDAEYTFVRSVGLMVNPFKGVPGPAPTFTESLCVVGAGRFTGALQAASMNATNSRMTQLTVGPNDVVAPQPGIALIVNNTSIIDSSSNGRQPGSSGSFHQASFGSRQFTVSQDATDPSVIYMGSCFDDSQNPDFEIVIKKNVGVMIAPHFDTFPTPSPAVTEALEVMGNIKCSGIINAKSGISTHDQPAISLFQIKGTTNGSGLFSHTYPTGMFTSIPTVVATAVNTNIQLVHVQTSTATSFTVRTANSANAAQANIAVNVIVMG